MAYGGGRKKFDNNMRGVLFTNNEKRRGKEDPDMRGSVEIEGVQYWISGWWKESDKVDGEFLSLSVQEKQDESPQQKNRGRVERRQEAPRRGRSQEPEPDDEIPF